MLRMIRITFAFSRIALLKHCIDGANSDEWRFNREDIKGLQNVCFLSFALSSRMLFSWNNFLWSESDSMNNNGAKAMVK